MQFDQRLDQRQTQTRPDAILAAEAIEDMGLDVEWDTAAGVGDLDHRFPSSARGGDNDLATLRRMTQGIFDQVVEHLAQTQTIRYDRSGPLNSCFQIDARGSRDI